MSKEIGSKVKKIVADHLGVEEEKVVDEASFIDDLGADSLDTVELVMALKKNLGLKFQTARQKKYLQLVMQLNLLRVNLLNKLKKD